MTEESEKMKDLEVERRPARQLMRVRREFLCNLVTDGLTLEGKTADLNEQGIAVLLSEPIFARLDSTTVLLTAPDGSLIKMTGRVVRQQQTAVGEVLVGIQLADLPIETTTALIEKCAPDSPFKRETTAAKRLPFADILRWLRAVASPPAIPMQDRRRIPRLSIHTACTVLGKEPSQKGLTQDLSYTGFSVLFPNFCPDHLWGAILQIKFVQLKAMPIGIEHRGPDALVRFRVEQIQEGEERWRELHYSYWRHLS